MGGIEPSMCAGRSVLRPYKNDLDSMRVFVDRN